MTETLIRSVFDQYSHLENRLTNGLVQVLARDQRLTREFVRLATGETPPKAARVSLSCQLMPGERPDFVMDERLAEERGIPDAWIWTDGWALLIEIKVGSSLRQAQVHRHQNTGHRRGFNHVQLLAITADERAPTWLGQFLQYIRAIEARGMAGDKILSTFTGIPFDENEPYSEGEARVTLRSLMRELRPRLAKSKVLHVSPHFEQRPLIGTWDVIRFRFSGDDDFTKHPHLTVAIGEATKIELTLPNSAKGEYRRRLVSAGEKNLGECLLEVRDRLRPLSRKGARGELEPRLIFEILQRHFYARRFAVVDGHMRFDVEALIAGDGSVKHLPGWIPAARTVITDARNVNLQVQLVALYPFSTRSISHTPEFVNAAAEAAEAMQPFLTLLTGNR